MSETSDRAEEARFIAEMWRLNDERNKRLAEESANRLQKQLKEGLK